MHGAQGKSSHEDDGCAAMHSYDADERPVRVIKIEKKV